MNKTTRRCWSFVGIYFNQDWPEDYGTEEASIDAFLVETPAERATLRERDRVGAWTISHPSRSSPTTWRNRAVSTFRQRTGAATADG